MHRLDLADLVPTLGGQIDQERRVGGLGQIRVVFGARDENREVGTVGVGDEPLVPVEHPLLAVLVAVGADQCGVGACDFRFGHRETRPGGALRQRPEVGLLLLVGAPVQQRVHVALIRGLTVEHPRAVVALRRFGLHHGELDMAKAHTAPILGHMGQPEALLEGKLAQLDQLLDAGLSREGLVVAMPVDLIFGRLHHLGDERADTVSDVFELGGEGEVDGHGYSRRGGRIDASAPGVRKRSSRAAGTGRVDLDRHDLRQSLPRNLVRVRAG